MYVEKEYKNWNKHKKEAQSISRELRSMNLIRQIIATQYGLMLLTHKDPMEIYEFMDMLKADLPMKVAENIDEHFKTEALRLTEYVGHPDEDWAMFKLDILFSSVMVELSEIDMSRLRSFRMALLFLKERDDCEDLLMLTTDLMKTYMKQWDKSYHKKAKELEKFDKEMTKQAEKTVKEMLR
jgi:hypothetical protein